MTGMHGLRGRITAVVAAVATLASGMAFAAPANAAAPTGKAAGSARVGADPANCDHVGALGSSGVNGTSHWSLGQDGTLTIEAGTLASGCTYAAVHGDNEDVTDIKKIELTGQVTAGADSSYLFAGMDLAAEFDGLEKLNTGSVTNMHAMFSTVGATSLDVSHWDTSSVTDMQYMFDDDEELVSLDVSHWDTGSVTDMSHMFGNDEALVSVDASNWDTSSVTDMQYMFANDSVLASVDVSHWDTGSVTDMSHMFANDRALASVDVSHWDTGSVTDMQYMFNDDLVLASLDLSNWDTGKVTDMEAMFADDQTLASLDVSHWDTGKVTDMQYMFDDDEALVSLDVSHWDTGKVTHMVNMFADDQTLASLDLSNWDTGKVTHMSYMFENAGLHKVEFGSNFRFIGENGAAGFPEAGTDGSGRYTGKWVNVGSGTADAPKGSNVWTAEQLMASYDGSRDADTYVWQPKDPVVSPGVTVKYVDEQGRSVHADQSIKGNVGASYDASTAAYRLDVRGYTLDESKLPANAKGTLSDKMQTVVYTYKKNPVASPGVTVRYVDEQGNRVHADRSITGNVGASYDASTPVYRLDVRGYTLDASKLPANAKGVLSDKPVTVTYTYRKAAAPAPAPNNNGGNANANAGGDADSGSLATTGASIALASLGGVLLLAAGVALLWRRRRA